jgi:hypothetical protein
MVDVAIVLDPTFGERLTSLVALAPIWIVGSDINRATYERLWRSHKHTGHGEKDAITGFGVKDENNRIKGLLDILPDVEIHHGRAENNELVFPSGFVLKVIGVPLSADITKALQGYGFTSFVEEPDGFQATKIKTPERS